MLALKLSCVIVVFLAIFLNARVHGISDVSIDNDKDIIRNLKKLKIDVPIDDDDFIRRNRKQYDKQIPYGSVRTVYKDSYSKNPGEKPIYSGEYKKIIKNQPKDKPIVVKHVKWNSKQNDQSSHHYKFSSLGWKHNVHPLNTAELIRWNRKHIDHQIPYSSVRTEYKDSYSKKAGEKPIFSGEYKIIIKKQPKDKPIVFKHIKWNSKNDKPTISADSKKIDSKQAKEEKISKN